jgi:hypothetical protein
MTTAREFGSVPTSAERLDRALALIAAHEERISDLERKLESAVTDDGAAPRPLGPTWKPIGEAAQAAGYSSEAGLRRRMVTGARWWCRRAGRIWVDTAACPCRR